MFKTLKNNTLIVITRLEYLEVEILSKFIYPFIEIRISSREHLEADKEPLYVFSTKNNSSMFEQQNKRIIFKMNLPDYFTEIHDYHCIVFGIDEQGHTDEILRYAMSLRYA